VEAVAGDIVRGNRAAFNRAVTWRCHTARLLKRTSSTQLTGSIAAVTVGYLLSGFGTEAWRLLFASGALPARAGADTRPKSRARTLGVVSNTRFDVH